MQALIVYESMYGNTHVVANHIGEGLRSRYEVEVVPAHEATLDRVAEANLLVVGGPTHVHGMSSERSRKAAKDALSKPGAGLRLDPDAESEGLRDWFHGLPVVHSAGALAFDTRLDAASLLTGRASRAIEKRLMGLGYDLAADPESFLVDKQTNLLPGEAERAMRWASEVAESLAANP
jgi:hypothetical protein